MTLQITLITVINNDMTIINNGIKNDINNSY